ncbi:MAG: lysylphosphatidylglycerol synthase transmembrane domain-containing protein [Rhodothermaceae bacterium]
MQKKLNILLILIGLGIIYYFVNNFGLENIWYNIRLSGWQLFNVLGIWAVIYLLNSYVLKIILGSEYKKIGFAKLYSITISSYAINFITPFVSLGGEPYKIYRLQKKIDTKTAVSSTVLYAMLHMLAHTFFWVLGVFIAFGFVGDSLPTKILLGVILIVVVFLIWFFFSRHKKGVLKSASRLIAKLKFLKSLNAKILNHKEKIDEIDFEIIELYTKRKKDFWTGLIIEFIARVLSSLEIYFIMAAIGISFSVWDAVYVTAAFTLMMNIIFFIPMELGTRESSLYLLVNGLSSVIGAGIFVAVVSRIREVFWIIVGIVLIQISGNKFSFFNSVKEKKNGS